MNQQAAPCVSAQERDTLERILHDVACHNRRQIVGISAERVKFTVGFGRAHSLLASAGSIAIDGVEFGAGRSA